MKVRPDANVIYIEAQKLSRAVEIEIDKLEMWIVVIDACLVMHQTLYYCQNLQ